MNQSDIEKRIEGLAPAQAKAVICALAGHSRIVTTCFGYIYCARCEAQIGDSLAGGSSNENNVIVGHDCNVCRSNFAKLDWHDTFMTPDPFDSAKIAEQRRGREALEKFKTELAATLEARSRQFKTDNGLG